ncbi:MAG TPA: dienelactone hydrolase family protein [Gaiellaceae bacterium]|nr:dienelactone hydrolase family protein [Gaiellaceae bacterium]
MRLVPLALVVAALAGCGGSSDPFSFDATQPLGVRVAQRGLVAGVRVTDLSFAGPDDRVPAYLVEPTAPGRHPAVVFLHGAGGSRDDFVGEAIALAQRGLVGLALTSSYERSTDLRVRENTEPVSVDRMLEVRSVVDVRRALQLLRDRSDVDPKRIGLLGYSRGCQWAALAASVEHPQAVVLMGPRAEPSHNVLPAKDRHLVTDLDTVRYMGRIAPAKLLLQGGRYDDVIPPADVTALYRAAKQPKQLHWYPTGHEFSGRTLNDQLAFLVRVLGSG